MYERKTLTLSRNNLKQHIEALHNVGPATKELPHLYLVPLAKKGLLTCRARPWGHLKTNRRILKSTRKRAESQCKDFKTGVTHSFLDALQESSGSLLYQL